MTKVGLWYVLSTIVVAMAATNTGNNALYMVLATMLALLVLSGFVSHFNVRSLEIELVAPDELFARTPADLRYVIQNRSRWMPHWLLLLRVENGNPPILLPHLPLRARREGLFRMSVPRRGLHRMSRVHVSSLFPLGLFRKGMRYGIDLELVVFPELLAGEVELLERDGPAGDESVRRAGWGHELHALRPFRPGDDPRSVHWKQSARTGSMIYMEREAEECRRLTVVLDNAVGPLVDERDERRFERMVSEAATASLEFLDRGYEVELVTRHEVIPAQAGRRQRLAILHALALVEALPRSREPLAPPIDEGAELRIGAPGGERRGSGGRAATSAAPVAVPAGRRGGAG